MKRFSFQCLSGHQRRTSVPPESHPVSSVCQSNASGTGKDSGGTTSLRKGVCIRAVLFTFLAASSSSFAVEEKTAEELITPKTQTAITKGLRFLAGRQIDSGRDKGAFGATSYAGSVGIAGLAGLALMADGNTPGVGKYGKQVENAVGFLVRNTNNSGYIAKTGNEVGNMYCHGFAMLFMTQAAGMSMNKDLDDKVRQSINLLVAAQNNQGGWRYRPVKSDADLSVTVCQIMALRAARDAGFHVPDKTREQCIDYVKKSQAKNGSFSYTMGRGGGSFPLTASGVVSLYSAGIYDDPMIELGLKFLDGNAMGSTSHYYYYGNYYAVQAMWHAGGQRWNTWYPRLRDELLSKQGGDGSWSSSYGPEYGTAMALIILQMPKEQIPVFAR